MNLRFLFVLSVIFAVLINASCGKGPTCDDGIQNQSELGIDCCGPCADCIGLVECNPNQIVLPTCTDGVQNGSETGVDCGGSCTPCSTVSAAKELTAKVDGATWTATTINAIRQNDSTLVLSGTAQNGSSIYITYTGNFTTGSAQVGDGMVATYLSPTAQSCGASEGSVTFTTFDTGTKKIAVSFSFACSVSGGSSQSVTQGSFANITYQ